MVLNLRVTDLTAVIKLGFVEANINFGLADKNIKIKEKLSNL